MNRYFRNILSLPQICRALIIFEKSWSLHVAGRHEEAELLFSDAEHLADKELPIEYQMMKGRMKFSLRKNDECIECLCQAWRQIEENNKMSEDNKNYLKLYIYGFFEIYADHKLMDLSDFTYISDKDVSLENVSRRWKGKFPVRDHYEWNKFGVDRSVSGHAH